MEVLRAYKGLVLSGNIDDYPQGIIIPVDKPYRWTSADVIRKIKFTAQRHFGKRNLKVGHAGTLDPLASGVLLVCIGKATKLAEELQAAPKQYLAGVAFGATTPSYDREKEIDAVFSLEGVSRESLEAALPQFIGEQWQIAPLFSAKNIDGVRAYEMARKLYKAGKPIDSSLLKASRINIYSLKLTAYDIPLERTAPASASVPASASSLVTTSVPAISSVPVTSPDSFPASAPAPASTLVPDSASHSVSASASAPTSASNSSAGNRIHVAELGGHKLIGAEILVDCSKGTYIRSLARDLGEALGSGAFLTRLRRTRNGNFDISDTLSLDDVTALFSKA
jgi:tRNA pseudouridine55 synthase